MALNSKVKQRNRMDYIGLTVTNREIAYADDKGPNNRQIAIQGRSEQLRIRTVEARRENRLTLRIGGEFTVILGDTTAIWSSHQESEANLADFNSLFNFLAQRTGRQISFVAEVVES
jgi:hypothetical protein